MRTSKYTFTLHLLTQSQSHSIQSLLTHRSSQDWLRFQGVLWANSNHTEGNRILLFAYCPNNNPKAGTQGWSHITAQSKNWNKAKGSTSLMRLVKVFVCSLYFIFHFYILFYPFWSPCFSPRRISGNQLRYISGHALQGLHNLKVL